MHISYVNGAFNLGNSGGPVIDPDTLTVVGVVHAKMAPLPDILNKALNLEPPSGTLRVLFVSPETI